MSTTEIVVMIVAVCFALFVAKPRKIKYIKEEPSRQALIAYADEELEEKEQALLRVEKAIQRAEKELATCQKKVQASKKLFEGMTYSMNTYLIPDINPKTLSKEFDNVVKLAQSEGISLLSDTDADLKCIELKQLKALYKANEKSIKKLTEEYQSHYRTKGNATIYKLMVMALDVELRLILQKLRYGKLEKAVEEIKAIIAKYYVIATEGNQTIVSTLTRFIGQLEYFYIEAVKIEYEAYVQEERAREEQRAIREQMKQEAEERKRLEAEKKKVEAEEKKYQQEMQRVREQISKTSEQSEIEKLYARIEELTKQLNAVEEKKEEIVNLQNGKAGTVYVISNIGSFGDNVFKVGMTRRLDPQERINELGDASVPFPFDVHSFIFSEDAPALEHALHQELDNRRVNKVNLRKEFFRISLDELEELVGRIDPSAPFKRTILAEQYRQSA